MLNTKEELREFIAADARACHRSRIKPYLIGDEVWRFQLCLRKNEYDVHFTGLQKFIRLPLIYWHKLSYQRKSVQLGFTIPLHVFGKGLSIAHRGTIVVHTSVKVGDNCRIHEGVTIGATSGCKQAARIGNNVFIASGAKIIGDLTIADDVAIGANAVVVRSIEAPGTTWAGVPARKISDKDSHANLSPTLFA